MPTSMTIAHQSVLDRIVSDVLSVMFAATSATSNQLEIVDGFTASVSFVGKWKGAVLLRCGVSTGKQLAQRLFKLSEVSPDDVADAMGELANMIGGNLKSVLPPGVLLSVPNVALGNDLAIRVWGGYESSSSHYSCEAGTFEITLVHSLPN